MKKLILLGAAAASVSLAACSDDRPTRVVHETRVIHEHRSSDQVNVPANNNSSSDSFEAVERPSTYSR